MKTRYLRTLALALFGLISVWVFLILSGVTQSQNGVVQSGASGRYVDPLTPAQRLAMTKSAREKLRQEYKQEGLYQDVAARELEWKEKSKGLRLGMSLEDVVKVMGGQPSSRFDFPPESEKITQIFIDYTPDPNRHPAWRSGFPLPYDNLSLVFDQDAKLTKISWIE